MHLKIYIHNKPLYLCDSLDDQLNSLIHLPDNVFIDELNAHTVKSMLKEMSLPEVRTGIFWHGDFQKLKNAFFKKFEIIVAGGGVVQNELQELLLIFRRGYWDLPKGKMDKGETLEECAIREVQEETGLKKVKLKKPITVTYHSYELGTHHIIKESHWYYMKAKSSEQLIAQTEEDITEIKWVNPSEIQKFINGAYPSIADVLSGFLTQ